jgi:hypothetical protein
MIVKTFVFQKRNQIKTYLFFLFPGTPPPIRTPAADHRRTARLKKKRKKSPKPAPQCSFQPAPCTAAPFPAHLGTNRAMAAPVYF